MARVTLTVQDAVRTGLEASYAAAETDGNAFYNTGREVLHVKNGTTELNATVLTARTVDGQAVTNRTVTIDADTEQFIGPFPPSLFNQKGSTGDLVHVNWDDVSNVTVAVIRI